MDFSTLNKFPLGINRIKSYQIGKGNINNNYSRRIGSLKTELKTIEPIETHNPISPSSNHTFKSYLSKKKSTTIKQESLDIKSPPIKSSYTNLTNNQGKIHKKISKNALLEKFQGHLRRKSTSRAINHCSHSFHSINIERKYTKKSTHLTSNKNEHYDMFNFFEQPTLFEEIEIKKTNTNILKKKSSQIMHDENENMDENTSIYSKTHMTNKSILRLADLQNEIRKSFIGFGQMMNSKIISAKSYLNEEAEDEKSSIGGEDDNISHNSTAERIEAEKEKILKDRLRVFQRMGQVYDSLDEEDIAISTTYILPTSKILRIIDILVFIFSIYNLIYIPFFLGLNYIHCRKKGNFFNFVNIIEIVMDITFIIDTIIPFFIAYYTIDDILKTNLAEISSNYLNSYFIIDLCAAIPFKLIFELYDTKCNDIGYLSAPLFQNNVYYCLLLLKIPKAIKAFYNNFISQWISDTLIQYEHFNQYFGLYSGTIIFLSSLHMIACTFIFIGRCQYPGWIVYFGYENYSFPKLYLIAVYYIITTCTTVGYGDLLCITLVEKVFGLFMEIVGIFAYSFAVSAISNYVKIMNDKSEKYREKSEILDDIKLSHSELSEDLYMQIHRHLKFKYMNNAVLDRKVIINSLPITLKNSLVYEMYKPIIKSFVFFKNFDNIDFIVKVILNFKPIIAIKNDILIKDGDFVEDLIFVKRGRLSLDIPIKIEQKELLSVKTRGNTQLKSSKTLYKAKTMFMNILTNNVPVNEDEDSKEEEEEKVEYYKILDIQKNEHFGDILMFLNKRCPLRVKVKSRIAELFYLNKKDAIEISQSYSQIWKSINKKSLFNWQQIKRLMIKVAKIFSKINNEEEEVNNIFLTTSTSLESQLKSIPSLSNLTVENELENENENENEKKDKNENEISKKNNKKKESVSQLKTIKESVSFEADQEESEISESNKKDNNTSRFSDLNSKTMKTTKTIKTMKTRKINSDESESESDNQKDSSHESNLDSKYNKSTINENGIIENKKSLSILDSRKKLNLSRNLSDSLDKNFISIDSNVTPYKPNEINNEIYPDETFIAYSNQISNKETTEKRLQSLFLKKNLDLSICSTEISFSIQSEYENLEELSDYQYKKSPILQRKVREIVTGTQFKYKSSLRAKTAKGANFVKKKTSFAKFEVSNNIKKNSTFHKNSYDKKTENDTETEKDINSEHNNFLNNPTIKKAFNKKKDLLNVINQNIERNYMNLNDPDLFYNEFFQKIFDKYNENESGITNTDDFFFNEDDEEILKKFHDVNIKNVENKTPLEIFYAIKDKI